MHGQFKKIRLPAVNPSLWKAKNNATSGENDDAWGHWQERCDTNISGNISAPALEEVCGKDTQIRDSTSLTGSTLFSKGTDIE